MSNERFDKLMKKQLESVRPTYQTRAWDRFQKRLPAVGFWPWLSKFGGWVLSGLMLVGWLTTLYMVRENQRLIAQLSLELHKPNPAQPTSPPSTSLHSESVHLNRVDTVFMVKRTIIEHRHFYTPILQRLSDSTEPIDPSDSDTEPYVESKELLTKPSLQRATTTIHRRIKPGKSSRIPSLARQTNTGQPVERTAQVEKTKSILPLSADSTNLVSNTNPGSKEISIDTNQSKTPLKLPDQESVKLDSATHQPALAPTQEPAQPAKQSRPTFKFSSLRPRVGIESMAIRDGIGIGPTVELFLSENLGLSVGLQATQLHSQSHRDLNDFNATTGKDFLSQYQSFLPPQYDRIDDISIHTSVISLPITLKYYVPLKTNWSLVFQTGTSLDLAAYQQVHYESEYQGDERYNSFEVNSQRSLFHNFIFGAGIQYHKSRISGQIIPYYLYDFRSMANTPAGSNFGLKASVWLDLFK